MVDTHGFQSSHAATRRRFVFALGGSAAAALLPSSALAVSRPAPPASVPTPEGAQTQPLTPLQFAAKMQQVVQSFAKLREDAKLALAQYSGHYHNYTLSVLGLTTLNLGSEGELPVTTLQSEATKNSSAMLQHPPALEMAVSVPSVTGQTFDALYAQLPKLLDDANQIEAGYAAIRSSYETHTHTVTDHQQGFYVKPIYKHTYKLAASASDYPVTTERPAAVTVPPAPKPAATFPPLYVPSQQEVFLQALEAKVLVFEATARGVAQSVAQHHHPYRANDFQVVPIEYNSFKVPVLEALGPHTVLTTNVVIV